MQDFNLLDNEKIIKEIEPVMNLKKKIFITDFIFFLIILLGFIGLLLFGIIINYIVYFSTIILIISVVLALITSNMKYKKYHYWITNKRIITRRGFIGYRINSIPLERISDIIISRTVTDRIFGLTGLYIQSLAGQISYGSYGAEGSMPAISEPLKIQELILRLVKLKRQSENLTI
jgi:uncharacterized membrane protein YdbT with pleckstrin-like domain